MSSIDVRDAEAGFSSLVDQASKGETVTIARHGKPVAAPVSIEAAEAARKALGTDRPNFGEYLMAFPGGIEFEHDGSKMRDVDL